MLMGNDEQVFLPFWRGGRIIFFTNIVSKESTRISYFAAAASEPQSIALKRTGKAPINPEQMKFCQSIADNGIELQKFFAAIGSGNLDHFVTALKGDALPYPENTNPLIFTCIYLDFLRKYAVDSEIYRLYESSPPKTRFSADRSVGIYKILTARLQSDKAEKLIDQDLAPQKPPSGSSMSVANLFRECAIVKFDQSKYSEAQSYMLRAVKLHNTEDKWRRLADFAHAAGERDKTIDYFLKAAEMKPLPAPAALILGRSLVEDGRFDQAQEYVEQALEIFAKPAGILMEKIAAAQTS